MTTVLTLITVGFVLLFKGGDLLVDGAGGIARKKNIPPFIIGMTLVAFGTSAPELIFNVISTARGHSDFALSNVAGSNLINLCVGIGVSAVVRELRIERRHFRLDLVFLFACPALVLGMALFSRGAGLEVHHGVALLGLFFAYIYLTRRKFNDCRERECPAEGREGACDACTREWCVFVLGCVLLYAGGELVFRNALSIVRRLGVSESVVGLTVIAFGTSIPDCAASIIAAAKRQNDIAVGNIIGSNIFNVLLVLGSTVLVAGGGMPFSRNHLFDFGAVLVLSLAFSSVAAARRKLGRLAGALLLAFYPLTVVVRLTVLG